MTVDSDAARRLAGQRRNLTGRTGCGLCGAESLEQALRMPRPVGRSFSVTASRRSTSTRRRSVGRHNALDKLIGALFRSGRDPGSGFILVSSRASYEMVYKTAAAGVELLLAVSAVLTYRWGQGRHERRLELDR